MACSALGQDLNETIRAEADLDIKSAKFDFSHAQNVNVELYADKKTSALTSVLVSWEQLSSDSNDTLYFLSLIHI